MPPPLALDSLPLDVLDTIASKLESISDLVSLAKVCPALHRVARGVLERRALTVRQGACSSVLPHWTGVRDLTVIGPSPWATLRRPSTTTVWLPQAMPHLRCLALRDPRYPPESGFWPAVFRGCPQLRDVRVSCDFGPPGPPGRYLINAIQTMQLVVYGAPRLHHLEIRGWGALVEAPILPAVESETLCTYVALFPQAPVPVDSPALHTLDACDPTGHLLTSVRRGRGSLRDLTWRVRSPSFDAGMLAEFSALRRLCLRLCGPGTRRCIASLRRLPAGIEDLEIVLTVGDIDDDDDDFWRTTAPLEHLTGLRRLGIHLPGPPATLGALAGAWLGAHPGVEAVEAVFESEAWSDADAEWDTAGLAAWLEQRPSTTATLCNAPWPTGPIHPRARLR